MPKLLCYVVKLLFISPFNLICKCIQSQSDNVLKPRGILLVKTLTAGGYLCIVVWTVRPVLVMMKSITKRRLS